MHLILSIIILLILVVVCLFCLGISLFTFWHMFQTVVYKKAPFVPIPKEILQNIVNALALRPDDMFYDLGCGDGRVLDAALAAQPKIHCFGVEYDPWPAFLARWRLRKHIKNNLARIIRGDMFKQDFNQATVIYTYLFPEYMNKLLPKLQRELKPGSRLVSCDFFFANKEPLEIIDLNRPKNKLGRFIYIYQF